MNKNEILEALEKAADSLNPVAVNDFFNTAIETNMEYLNLVSENLSIEEIIKRTHAITAGSLLQSMFMHFVAQDIIRKRKEK